MATIMGCWPQPLTSFVGRGRELALIAACLGDARASSHPTHPASRLLTLTGPAGIGKTRLALQAAGEASGSFAHGACWVSLAEVPDPALVASVIARRLDLRETARSPAPVLLRRYLKPREMLLVLDNFEHLIEAAPLLEELLTECPGLVLLITSRQALHVKGEQEFVIPALSVPELPLLPDAAEMVRYEGVALFVERARAANRKFLLTPANAPLVAAICRELDGLPLAIELAAARAKFLSVGQIRARLADRFSFLVDGAPAGPGAGSRHHTLRAAIDWSYCLLSPLEQASFRRLGAFAGSFTLEAAEAVVGGERVVDTLSQLVDKSLVQIDYEESGGGEPRYSLLETIRQYACEQMEAAGEGADAAARHLSYYAAYAERAEPGLRGPAQMEWVSRLEDDLDNLWAAANWSHQHEPGAEGAQRLIWSLSWFWRLLRGNPSRWLAWAQELLSSRSGQDHGAVRARALLGAGTVLLLQGDYDAAHRLAEESLGLWSELPDRGGMAHALHLLALALHARGETERAVELYERSLAIRRQERDTWGIAQALNNLATIAEGQGDVLGASARYMEALGAAREAGDGRLTGLILIGLASASNQQGNCPDAHRYYLESLAIAAGAGDKWLAPQALDGLAGLALAGAPPEPRLEHLAHAAHLWAAAQAMRDAIGSDMWPADRPVYEARLAAAKAALGETAWARAWGEGSGLRLDDLPAFERAAGSPCPATSQGAGRAGAQRSGGKARGEADRLTRREREIVILIAQGKTNRAIAESLVVTERTVGTHVGNILAKLGFSSRSQVAVWAVEQGLLRSGLPRQ